MQAGGALPFLEAIRARGNAPPSSTKPNYKANDDKPAEKPVPALPVSKAAATVSKAEIPPMAPKRLTPRNQIAENGLSHRGSNLKPLTQREILSIGKSSGVFKNNPQPSASDANQGPLPSPRTMAADGSRSPSAQALLAGIKGGMPKLRPATQSTSFKPPLPTPAPAPAAAAPATPSIVAADAKPVTAPKALTPPQPSSAPQRAPSGRTSVDIPDEASPPRLTTETGRATEKRASSTTRRGRAGSETGPTTRAPSVDTATATMDKTGRYPLITERAQITKLFRSQLGCQYNER